MCFYGTVRTAHLKRAESQGWRTGRNGKGVSKTNGVVARLTMGVISEQRSQCEGVTGSEQEDKLEKFLLTQK